MASNKKKELQSDETRRQFEKHYRVVELTAEQAADGLTTGCWLWQSRPDKDGYGEFRWNGELYRAHRFSYILNVGPITPGHDVDHRCNNRACVNPEHLQDITHAGNMALQKARAGADPNPGLTALVRREATTAERALAWCLSFMDDKRITAQRIYGVAEMKDAPWRNYVAFERYGEQKKNDGLTLLALFLYAVSKGNPAYQTARDILDIHEWSLQQWARANPEWKFDYELALRDGKLSRPRALKERLEDDLEARIPFAPFKDLTRLYEVMTRNEESRADRKAKKNQQGSLTGGPTINFLFPPGTTPEDIAGLTERIIDVQAREVPVDENQPALPPPGEWDEDFGDDDEAE